jgi:hypothetical protein
VIYLQFPLNRNFKTLENMRKILTRSFGCCFGCVIYLQFPLNRNFETLKILRMRIMLTRSFGCCFWLKPWKNLIWFLIWFSFFFSELFGAWNQDYCWVKANNGGQKIKHPTDFSGSISNLNDVSPESLKGPYLKFYDESYEVSFENYLYGIHVQ